MSNEEARKAAIRREDDLARNAIEAGIWKAIPAGSKYMVVAQALMNVLAAIIRWEDRANEVSMIRGTPNEQDEYRTK